MHTKGALAVALVVVATASCGSMAPRGTRPGGPAAVKSGVWGGQHIVMTVATSKTDIEFDCGKATVSGSLETDAAGAFSAAGSFQPERPGPATPGAPAARPMRLTGAVKGDDMQVRIVLTDRDETLGDFSLALGGEPRLVKCR